MLKHYANGPPGQPSSYEVSLLLRPGRQGFDSVFISEYLTAPIHKSGTNPLVWFHPAWLNLGRIFGRFLVPGTKTSRASERN